MRRSIIAAFSALLVVVHAQSGPCYNQYELLPFLSCHITHVASERTLTTILATTATARATVCLAHNVEKTMFIDLSLSRQDCAISLEQGVTTAIRPGWSSHALEH